MATPPNTAFSERSPETTQYASFSQKIATFDQNSCRIICGPLLASCSGTKTAQVAAPAERNNAPTISPSAMPVENPGSTTKETPLADFGPLCTNSKDLFGSEISLNGKWMAAECYGENNQEASPLQVVSLDHSKEWKIYFGDVVKGDIEYGRKNIIVPYRWSKDGRFLYAASPTIASGCCWIGGKYVLLIRLNLETGFQEELLNTIDPSSTLPISFTISEDDGYLLFTPVTQQLYDFTVMDLRSQETRVVKLEVQKPIDLEFTMMHPNEDTIVLPLFTNRDDNNYVVDSIVLIELTMNEQRILISDLKEDEELYPVLWANKDHVLLRNANSSFPQNQSTVEYWLLNISTGQSEKVEKPKHATQDSVYPGSLRRGRASPALGRTPGLSSDSAGIPIVFLTESWFSQNGVALSPLTTATLYTRRALRDRTREERPRGRSPARAPGASIADTMSPLTPAVRT